MKVSERVKTEMRVFQRHFQASVLFSHLPIYKEDAAEIVNVFLRFCVDEGLASPGLLEGLTLPRPRNGRTQAHALLGLLPETNTAEAIAIVEVFLDIAMTPVAARRRSRSAGTQIGDLSVVLRRQFAEFARHSDRQAGDRAQIDPIERQVGD